jgi:hypothetical protein
MNRKKKAEIIEWVKEGLTVLLAFVTMIGWLIIFMGVAPQ